MNNRFSVGIAPTEAQVEEALSQAVPEGRIRFAQRVTADDLPHLLSATEFDAYQKALQAILVGDRASTA